MKKIWLAGGCFWGVEAYFKQLAGVLETTVGYGQGTTASPTYQQVCAGETGHAEICEVIYDETILSLPQILEHFFRIIDPTTLDCQGADCGSQYRSGIYYQDESEKLTIWKFIAAQQQHYKAEIVVEASAKRNFYPAEEEHQDYLAKNPGGYCHVDLSLAQNKVPKD